MTTVGVKEILIAGGPTLLLLIALSIYSIALMWERWRFYKRTLSSSKALFDKIRGMISAGDLGDAVAYSRQHKSLAGPVVLASLIGPTNREERKRSAERAAARAAQELERGVTHLGTIASVAPFIGLFGTVVGVMRAFRDLASAAGAGPGVVAIGISEALVCTAAGLVVAIPAVAAYNHFNVLSSRYFDELRWISEEVMETLAEKHK